MPGFTQDDRQAWLNKFIPTLPPKVADIYQRMLHGYPASQGPLPTNAPQFAEGGLADVTPFRRRLYAPLRRHHNYPAVRQHPADAVSKPEGLGGLGDLAYA
jgi:hypothetical protein